MTINRKALDTRSAADYLHIAKTQSTEYAIMAINKDHQVVGDLNPIRDILNDYVANGSEDARLDYAKRIADYTANNDVLITFDRYVDISNAERCANIINRAVELGKINERLIMAINNNICNTLKEIGIEPATDSLMESICVNIEKLEQANDNCEVDCITLGDAVMDVFYGAFTDYVGLRPDYVCDVDKDWMDPTREGNECFVDSSDWEWCFDVRRDGEVYYMAADGSITTYWQDALLWCKDGFYICDRQVDSFGNIVLIIAMRH